MTHDEILQGLYDNTLIGNAPEVKDLTNAGLADGMDPEKMLYDALIPSLEEVGEGAGFTVYDLGVNVAPEVFVAQVQEHKPDIVGFSAFLTTTMPMFKANINALEKAGIRDDVIVMVGGAPVTQEYADKVGADGYAADASSAVRLAKDLIARRRSAVPA